MNMVPGMLMVPSLNTFYKRQHEQKSEFQTLGSPVVLAKIEIQRIPSPTPAKLSLSTWISTLFSEKTFPKQKEFSLLICLSLTIFYFFQIVLATF